MKYKARDLIKQNFLFLLLLCENFKERGWTEEDRLCVARIIDLFHSLDTYAELGRSAQK